jgi:hypothetical protein
MEMDDIAIIFAGARLPKLSFRIPVDECPLPNHFVPIYQQRMQSAAHTKSGNKQLPT